MVVTVNVLVEGQTEENFINKVVAPSFYQLNIFLMPMLMSTSSSGKGGAINFDRLKFHLRNVLKQRQDTYITTFFDLYALDNSFPQFEESKKFNNLYERVECVESALKEEMSKNIEFRLERFIPYIQPHEYEGLLFSDVEKFANVEPNWIRYLENLEIIRNAYENPEYINDGYETAPSKRLNILCPKFKKTSHGVIVAQNITLEKIEEQCPHFRLWLQKLRNLKAL